MLKGFKDFILRGNLVELAVAFIIGGAFATVVTATVAMHHGHHRQDRRHARTSPATARAASTSAPGSPR